MKFDYIVGNPPYDDGIAKGAIKNLHLECVKLCLNSFNKKMIIIMPIKFIQNDGEKVEKYKQENPEKKVINLGVGDVTLPLPKAVVEAMKKACDEMQNKETFRGYGPELGYDFLKKKILEEDYLSKGIEFELDEIFISDGINSDIGNINDIFDINNKL